jgi:hypothetical protein
MKSAIPKKSKRPGVDRRWTLLFIGDHGNVLTLKHFKAIVIGAGSLFVLAVVFMAVLLYFNKVTLNQNSKFQKQVTDAEKQITKLRHDKEILMARLVLAESKTKESPAKDLPNPKENKDAEPAAEPPQPLSKPETAKTGPKQAQISQTVQTGPRSREPLEADQQMSVAVESFKVSRESDTGNLKAEFKIKNTSAGSLRVAGHTVIVLKGNELQKENWLVMPAVDLAGEKPSGRRGKRFSIQRFRTMSFTFKAPQNSDQFQTAAVYVFTDTGQLLLEQDFSVKLPPVLVRSAEPPDAQTPDSKTPPSSAPPDSETPASGEAVDSSIEVPPVF